MCNLTQTPLLIYRYIAMLLLFCSTAIIAVTAENLVDSVEGLSKNAGISETFIGRFFIHCSLVDVGFLGIILLPIVGNACEHVTAVSSAIRNKMDLALNVAIGSSLQIGNFIHQFYIEMFF
jgi:Ca2+:H+ antiporter